MQLKAAKVIARGRVRRPAEEGREGSDVPDVGLLDFLAVTARRHVVDHALTQRADGLLGHRKLLSRMGLNPTILRQTLAFPLSLPAYPLHSLPAPTARAV